MSAADLSLFAFGIYVAAVPGLGFTLVPNTILGLFRVPETGESWIRILGFVVLCLGAYYVVAGLTHATALEWASVVTRPAFLVFLVILAMLKQAKPVVILFGVIDAIGAGWTLAALLRG